MQKSKEIPSISKKIEGIMVAGAGFVEKLQTRYLPRWDISRLRQVNPWLWLGENAGKGIASEEYIPFAELAGELQ